MRLIDELYDAYLRHDYGERIAVDALRREAKDVLHSYEWWFVKGITSVTDSIDNAPTIDPVKHGYWRTFTPLAQTRYVCSECFATGKYHIWSDVDGLEYCPRCGARMEVTDDDVGNP